MASIAEGIVKDLRKIPAGIRRMDVKKVLIASLPYVAVAWVMNRISCGYRVTPGDNALLRLLDAFEFCSRTTA